MSDIPASDNAIHYAECTGKGFLRVGGAEAGAFLQSLLTVNIDLLEVGACAPGALLTPQGRVLHDMMIYHRDADNFVIEADGNGLADLFSRLRRYRLRRPIELEILEGTRLWLCWGAVGEHADTYRDPRHASLGQRWLQIPDVSPDISTDVSPDISPDISHASNPFTEYAGGGDIKDWHALRIIAGIPEGPIDLTPERALMLEAGLDQLGAVDFAKGCYIGQEVTARTHYRGLVKRRLVPLHIAAPKKQTQKQNPPAIGTEILLDGKAVATTKTSAMQGDGAVCLALLKLSEIHLVLEGKATLTIDGATGTPVIPTWMLPLPNTAKTDTA